MLALVGFPIFGGVFVEAKKYTFKYFTLPDANLVV